MNRDGWKLIVRINTEVHSFDANRSVVYTCSHDKCLIKRSHDKCSTKDNKHYIP